MKINEKLVYNNLKVYREIQEPKLNLGQLVRTADERRIFVKAIKQIGLIICTQ